MALNDRSLEMLDEGCDRRVIFGWDRLNVEEAAAVIKFHLTRRWQSFQRVGNLTWNRAGCDRVRQSVLPQIAHHAMPWALAVGQKDGCDGNNLTRRRALFFHEKCVRLLGIEFRPLRSLREDPFRLVRWVRRIFEVQRKPH